MAKLYKIKTIGMQSRDIESLKRLIRIYQTTGRYQQFAVVSEGVVDVTMVNFDVADVDLPEVSDGSVVINAYRATIPPAGTHAIKMPFFGRKVIELLDNIVTQKEEEVTNALDIDNDAIDDNQATTAVAEVIEQSTAVTEDIEQPTAVAEENQQPTAVVEEPAENLSTTPADTSAYQEKVLVVEDSEIIRKGLSILLKQRDLDVTFAKDAENALEYLAVNNKFGLIFLDVVMPGMDGYKLCKRIKRSKAQKDSRVVMLTSKSSRFDKVRASFCGCDEYLTKPISPKDFLAFIDDHLTSYC